MDRVQIVPQGAGPLADLINPRRLHIPAQLFILVTVLGEGGAERADVGDAPPIS